MTAIARTAALCLVGCFALAACGPQVATDQTGGGPIAGVATTTATTTTTAPTTTSTTTPEVDPTTTTTTTTKRAPSVTAASVLAEFKALVRKRCAPAYTGGDTHMTMPTAESARHKSGSRWLVHVSTSVDDVLFDRAAGTVTSAQGPDRSLPMEYVFQCDPEVFISPVD